jgi:hypothetical protein
MSIINKKLAVAAGASALLASLGLAVAQSNDTTDPMAAPQEQHVDVNANSSGNHIYFFRDQGNSPETDPAAHLMLIKHEQPVPVATDTTTTTTTTTVAQASTPADNGTVAPAASDTSNTETSTDTTAAPMTDTQPALAPKADRN